MKEKNYENIFYNILKIINWIECGMGKCIQLFYEVTFVGLCKYEAGAWADWSGLLQYKYAT